MVSDQAPGDPVDGGPAGPASAHPGPAIARLPKAIADAIVEQARAEYPNEACALIVGSAPAAAGGEALRYERCRNRAASPYRYDIHPDDLFRISVEADDEDLVLWGIVHSHVRSPAVPSPTDIGLAFYPDALYILVSLAHDEADPRSGDPSIRAWRIVDGSIHEVPLGGA